MRLKSSASEEIDEGSIKRVSGLCWHCIRCMLLCTRKLPVLSTCVLLGSKICGLRSYRSTMMFRLMAA